MSALRPESVTRGDFVIVFRVPDGTGGKQKQVQGLLRRTDQDNPARGGGDTRWLAQNYTGRKIHTATKQDQLLVKDSDKG